MDVSLRLFLDANEFVGVLEQAREDLVDIFYGRGANLFALARHGEPLPAALNDRLRGSTMGSRTHFLAVGGAQGATHPDLVPANRIICATFGGEHDGVLRLSTLSARSNLDDTLRMARRLKRRLVKDSRSGVLVFGLPDTGERVAARDIRYTEGAQREARNGLLLRQSGVAFVGFELPANTDG